MFGTYSTDTTWGFNQNFNEPLSSQVRDKPPKTVDDIIALHVVSGVYLAVVLKKDRRCVLRTYSSDFQLLSKMELNNEQGGMFYSNIKQTQFQSPSKFTVTERYKTFKREVGQKHNSENASEVVFESSYEIDSLGQIESLNETPFSAIEILANGSCN